MGLYPPSNEGDSEVPDVNVWFQTSRSGRLVGRLPEGKTGIEALIEYEKNSERTRPDYEAWVMGMGEGAAGDYYLRCHGMRGPQNKQLTRAAFDAFRANGGTTYNYWYHQKLSAFLDTFDPKSREEAGEMILTLVDSVFYPASTSPDLRKLTTALQKLARRRRELLDETTT